MTQQLAGLYELQARRSAMLLDVQPVLPGATPGLHRQARSGRRGGLPADRVGDVGRRKVEIAGDIRDMESRLSDLPKTQRDILAMERKLGVNEKLAIYLLERKAATIIARASITLKRAPIECARHTGLVGLTRQNPANLHVVAGAGRRLRSFARSFSTVSTHVGAA